MRTLTILLKSNKNCPAPLICNCSELYLHLKPLALTPIRTAIYPDAAGVNLIYGRLQSQPINLGDVDADCKDEWQYIIEFDETQLTNPNELISQCDIEAICCEDCGLKTSIKIIQNIPWEYELSYENCEIILTNTIMETEQSVNISDVIASCPAPNYCDYFIGE